MDVTATAHQPYTTGIQRVVRELVAGAKGFDLRLVIFDSKKRTWTQVQQRDFLCPSPSRRRSRNYRLGRKIYGTLAEAMSRRDFSLKVLTSIQPVVEYLRMRLLNLPKHGSSAVGFTSPTTRFLLPEITTSPEHAAAIRDLSSLRHLSLSMFVHDLLPLTHPWLFPTDPRHNFPEYASLIPQANFLVVASEEVRRQCAAWVDLATSAGSTRSTPKPLIAPLPSTFPPRERDWVPPETPTFVVLGSVEPRKNLTRVAEAVHRIASSGRRIRLQVIGGIGWNSSPAIKAVRSAQLAGAEVEFHRSMTDTQVQEALGSASALVYCSLGEGYGLPVVEALSQRTPVITSDLLPLSSFSAFGGVLTVDPLDARSIAAGIEKLLDPVDRIAVASTIEQDKIPTDWQAWASTVLEFIGSHSPDDIPPDDFNEG